MGRVGSLPTKKRVVLKFSNEVRKATMPALANAGLRYGIVTLHIALMRLAPRSMAASSCTVGNRLRRELITIVAKVPIKQN